MRRGIARIAAVALLSATLSGAESGEDLFNQALRTVYADRDFEAAIQIYDRILRDFASDRALTAKTLVARGQAEQFLGVLQAKKSFEQVIRDHANQPAAATARRELAAVEGVLPSRSPAIYLADLDTSGVVRGSAVRLTPNWEHFERLPTFSPDGKRVAFRSILARVRAESGNSTAKPEWQHSIVVQDIETGRQTKYGGVAQNGPSLWFPDGDALLSLEGAVGGNTGNGSLVRIDLQKRTRTPIAEGLGVTANTIFMTNGGVNLNLAALSPVGTTLFVTLTALSGDAVASTLWRFDSVSGKQLGGFPLSSASLSQTKKDTATTGAPNRKLAVSPNGRTLAFMRTDVRDGYIRTVGVDGTTSPTSIVENFGVLHNLAWCKDRIFFGRASVESMSQHFGTERRFAATWQIMHIRSDGSGEPVFSGLEIDDLWSFDVSPDCSRIAFDALDYRISGTAAPAANTPR